MTVEEANVLGGLGSAVCETVCESCPVPVARVGVQDARVKSASSAELFEEYGLRPEAIVKAAKGLMG